MIEIISVSGGKFHKLAEPYSSSSNQFLREVLTACGRKVEPQNYFETVEDVNRFTGGRYDHFICRQCAAEPSK